MQKLRFVFLLLVAVLLLPSMAKSSSVGYPVPKGGNVLGTIYWNPSLNGTGGYVFNPNILTNANGQTAIGGTVNASNRLTVSPSGTAENAVSVVMPANATGDAFSAYGSDGNRYIRAVVNARMSYFGVYDPSNNVYYALASSLPAPAGVAALAGYYHGLGIGATSDNTNTPIFAVGTSARIQPLGVVSAAQAAPFSIYDTGKVQTANNVLDAGTGAASFAGSITSSSYISSTAPYQINSVIGVSGTSDGITSTGGIVTVVRLPTAGIPRVADYSLSSSGNGGSGAQTLAAGAAWTKYVVDTQTSSTTSSSLAAQFTPSTSRFIGEAIGKRYDMRMGFNVSITAGGAGYLEFGFDGSTAGDGSLIKTTTPVYVAGSALNSMSYLFDTTSPLFIRTSTGTSSPGIALLVRFVGTGTATISANTLTIFDGSGVSNN